MLAGNINDFLHFLFSRRGYMVLAVLGAAELTAALVSSHAQQNESAIIVPEIVGLPGGDALIGDQSGSGDEDEHPVHKSSIKPLGFTRTEITREQYAPFASERGYPAPDISGNNANLPIVYVGYDDARDYARWLSAKTGATWRLPTEAEWEYAARAGTNTLFQTGNDPKSVCAVGNIADATALTQNAVWEAEDCDDGFAALAPAKSFAPNNFGLYDFHGNVWEWVDGCGRSYSWKGSGAQRADCEKRSIRGGSYQSPAWFCRSSNRETLNKNMKRPDLGFRLVREE